MKRNKKKYLIFLFQISFFSHRSELKLNQFHSYFGVVVKKWLIIIRNKIIQRIEFLLDKDKIDSRQTVTNNNKLTSSAIEISQSFNKISQFWKRLGKTKDFLLDLNISILI